MRKEELVAIDYDTIEEMLAGVAIPRMFKVRQLFPDESVSDVYAETLTKLRNAGIRKRPAPGMSICITASSRGIDRQKDILKGIVDFVKENGADPFVIPAMGSHGGSTAEGQRALLEGYGITEEYLGCPIRSSMETVVIGQIEDDGRTIDVRVDRYAYEADGVIVFNRIKPHTDFRGPYESGLMKMMSIGMGKQHGADNIHCDGFGRFKTRIFLYGDYVRTHLNVIAAVSTVENAHDHCNRIDVIDSDDIPQKEKELLAHAFSIMARLPVEETDVLIVRQIGKDFSGSGMDPNITGTWATPYGSGGIRSQRVTVLDVSDASHGNAVGIGNADTTAFHLLGKIDFQAMYLNVLTSTLPQPVRIPMVLKDDEMAIKGAIKTCNGVDKDGIRIVMIRNSLDISELYMSEAYWEEASRREDLQILSEPEQLHFDSAGNLSLND